jgi:hypothetical protein
MCYPPPFVSDEEGCYSWANRRTPPANSHEVTPMPTSKSDASKAGKLLSKPSTPKSVKSVAASDLAQRKPTTHKAAASKKR